MGRNPLPAGKRRLIVNVTLSPDVVQELDRECVFLNVSRSRFIEAAVRSVIYTQRRMSREHLEYRVRDIGGVLLGENE